jgi:CubicO group peptidase (beta-lactamase class C family)
VFTGTLLADMVARGEVSLGYPVVEYLPKGVTMPARAGREITLADLSTHPSGLPNLPDNLVPRDMSNPYADYTFALMYDFLSEHELRRDIGSEFEYSNLGVGLLGHVLARHAETDYESLVRERIFEPLGMSMSTITLSGDTKAPMVRGHDAQDAATAGLGLFSPGRLSAAEAPGPNWSDSLRSVRKHGSENSALSSPPHRVRSRPTSRLWSSATFCMQQATRPARRTADPDSRGKSGMTTRSSRASPRRISAG